MAPGRATTGSAGSDRGPATWIGRLRSWSPSVSWIGVFMRCDDAGPRTQAAAREMPSNPGEPLQATRGLPRRRTGPLTLDAAYQVRPDAEPLFKRRSAERSSARNVSPPHLAWAVARCQMARAVVCVAGRNQTNAASTESTIRTTLDTRPMVRFSLLGKNAGVSRSANTGAGAI